MSLEDFQQERAEKIVRMRAQGVDPYPVRSARDTSLSTFLSIFDSLVESAKPVTLAGRIMATRSHGGAAFIDLYDGTGRVQAYLKKDELQEGEFEKFSEFADTGDFIEVSGVAMVTKRGEQSLLAKSWRMLSKSMRPIPDAWYGLKDEEKRYRERYLDLLLDNTRAEMLRKRSVFWNTIRQYLLDREFIEVETPVLENTTGGADARPFVTHHNALDIDLYLRISAGELWQKRLLVAGFEKTFEIGRIFRNEGMSNEHAQDYTQLEFYMAYADYRDGMRMAQELYRTVAMSVFGTTKFSIRGFDVDLNTEWETYDFCALISRKYGIAPLDTSIEAIVEQLQKHDIEYDKNTLNIERGMDLLWKSIRRTLGGPGFLIGVPVYLEPLAKRSNTNPEVVERFQIILAGSEMGKGFSELNDPVDQRERFKKQQALRDAGDEEAQMADMDFVEALEYGMPPAFGFGVSERLFSFLYDIPIREAQAFPLMRPKEKE